MLLATLLLGSDGLAVMPLVIVAVAVAYVASARLTRPRSPTPPRQRQVPPRRRPDPSEHRGRDRSPCLGDLEHAARAGSGSKARAGVRGQAASTSMVTGTPLVTTS